LILFVWILRGLFGPPLLLQLFFQSWVQRRVVEDQVEEEVLEVGVEAL